MCHYFLSLVLFLGHHFQTLSCEPAKLNDFPTIFNDLNTIFTPASKTDCDAAAGNEAVPKNVANDEDLAFHPSGEPKFVAPSVQIVWENETLILDSDEKENGNFAIVPKNRTVQDKIWLTCTATYPIQFVYNVQKSPKADDVGSGYYTLYKNFYDKTTYNFLTKVVFNFGRKVTHQYFTCRSRQFPCSLARSTTVEYRLVTEEENGGKKMNFSISNTHWSPPIGIFPQEPPQTEDRDMENGELCAVNFYYEEKDNTNFHTYGITCKFADGRPGRVGRRWCPSGERCKLLMMGQAVLPTKCWKRLDPMTNDECPNCPIMDVEYFWSQQVTCVEPNTSLIDSDEDVGDDDDSSDSDAEFETDTVAQTEINVQQIPASPSTIIFFGISREQDTSPPNIYILGDRPDPQDMIFMKPFPTKQLLGRVLPVRCSASRYLTAEGAFQFALEFEGRQNYRLLKVDYHDLLGSVLNTKTQTQAIQLDDPSLIKIHCFVSIKNTYEWLHTSRPIKVLPWGKFHEPSSSEPCKKNFLQPIATDLEVIESGSIKLSSRDTGMDHFEGKMAREGFAKIGIQCYSPHPVRILFDDNKYNTYLQGTFDTQSGAILISDSYFWKFENLSNSSSYHFLHSLGFTFKNISKRQLFHCQSIQYPCVHRTIEYSFDHRRSKPKFTLLPVTENVDLSVQFVGDKSLGLDGTGGNDTTAQKGEEGCEVTFLYEKTLKFPGGYNLYCRYPYGDAGMVVLKSCRNAADCVSVGGQKRQPKKCWKLYESHEGCPKCTPKVIENYTSMVVTCARHSGGTSTDHEASRTSIVFFGILPSDQTTRRHNIYLGDTLPPLNDILAISKVDPVLIFGEEVRVTCTSSAYSLSETIYIGLQSESPEGHKTLHIVPETKVFPLQHGKSFDNTLYAMSLTKKFQIKDVQLKQIYCIGWSLATLKVVNVSTPIMVLETRAPRISIGEGLAAVGSANLYRSYDNRTFNVTSQGGRGIFCAAVGKPIPFIQWSRDGQTIPVEQNKEETVSYRWSRIVFPITGSYVCTAVNVHGKAVADLTINVVPGGGGSGAEGTSKTDASESSSSIVLSVVLPTILVTLLVFGVVLFILWRKNQLLSNRVRKLTKEEMTEFVHGSPSLGDGDTVNTQNAAVHVQPYNPKFEIPRKFLHMDEGQVLGSGEFGMVVKGYVTQEGGSQVVAVKTVKKKKVENLTMNVVSLLSELKILAYLDKHENVASLVAACTADMEYCEIFVALEFCSNGNLLDYLRNHRSSFQILIPSSSTTTTLKNCQDNRSYTNQPEMRTGQLKTNLSTLNLLSFSRGFANGLTYLDVKDVIHGDLAARNILLTDDLCVKISDFGLSRKLQQYSNYVRGTREVPLPFKWLAVEILTDMKFSLKSDVWSFGVVLYEIFSLGECPFPGTQWNSEFVDRIIQGYRMGKPQFADDTMYDIMVDCWHKDPNERPSAGQLFEKLFHLESQLGAAGQCTIGGHGDVHT